MSKVYVFLADGFEEIEGLTVVDILRRAGVKTQMVSITEEKAVDLLVLPGGMPGTKHLGACEVLNKQLTTFCQEGKKVAAICAAPSVLGDLGLLKGKKAACYPGFEERLTGAEVIYEKVAVDGNITTSRGMGTAIPFALSLVAQLVSKEKAEELKKGIIYGHG